MRRNGDDRSERHRQVLGREQCIRATSARAPLESQAKMVESRTRLIRTKSCIINLKTAFVGWVMYTFPFPSLKFVYYKIGKYEHELLFTGLFHNVRQRRRMV